MTSVAQPLSTRFVLKFDQARVIFLWRTPTLHDYDRHDVAAQRRLHPQPVRRHGLGSAPAARRTGERRRPLSGLDQHDRDGYLDSRPSETSLTVPAKFQVRAIGGGGSPRRRGQRTCSLPNWPQQAAVNLRGLAAYERALRPAVRLQPGHRTHGHQDPDSTVTSARMGNRTGHPPAPPTTGAGPSIPYVLRRRSSRPC